MVYAVCSRHFFALCCLCNMSKKIQQHIFRIIGIVVIIFVLVWVSPLSLPFEGQEETEIRPPAVPVIDPASIPRIIVDKDSSREFMSNQLIVEFLPSVSEEESLRIIDSAGGTMLQRFTAAPLFLVSVKDEGDGEGARRAAALLNKNPQVKKADLNYLETRTPDTKVR